MRALRTAVVITAIATVGVGAGAPTAAGASGGTRISPRLLDSTLLSTPADQTITYGAATTVTSTLTDISTSTPIVGASVELLARPANATLYSAADTQVTDASGVATFAVAPTLSTAYRTEFAGDGVHHLAHSLDGTVLVSQIVKATLTRSKVKHRRTVEVWGTITPGGKSVELQRREHGTFTTLDVAARVKVQKLPNGKQKAGFILDYTPKKKGHQTLRVIADDDSLNAGAVSPSLSLTVT